jgi:hypothetical protein
MIDVRHFGVMWPYPRNEQIHKFASCFSLFLGQRLSSRATERKKYKFKDALGMHPLAAKHQSIN